MNFTKGEWLIDGRTVYALNKRGSNRFSCHVQEADDDTGKRISEEEVMANARLIAQAPALREVITNILELTQFSDELTNAQWQAWRRKAVKALAKADGKEATK